MTEKSWMCSHGQFALSLLQSSSSTTRGRFCPKNWWSSSVLMFFVVYYSAADLRTAEGCQSFSLPFVPAAGCSFWFTQAQHVQSSYGQTLDWTQSSFTFTAADCSIRVDQKTCWHPTGKKQDKNQLVKQSTVFHCAWGAVATTFAEMSTTHTTHV